MAINTQIRRQDRPKLIVLGVLVIFAVWMLLRGFMGSQLPHLLPKNGQPEAKSLPNLTRLHAALDLPLLARLEAIRYSGTRRNLFIAGVSLRQLRRQARAAEQQRQAQARLQTSDRPTGPPPPPPIPLKFYGYVAHSGALRQIFLRLGNKIFVVRAGETVARRYKIVSIQPTMVTIQDLTDQHTQLVPLTLE